METVLLAIQLGRIFYSRDTWLCMKFSVQWEPLKTLLIRVRPTTHNRLLNWDCHSPMSLSLFHKTSSLLHSQSVNILVNKSQHVSFKRWSNGVWNVDPLGSVHWFLLSNLSSGCNTQHKIGIINVTRKKRNLIVCYRYITVFEAEAESDLLWQKQIQKICHKGAL